MSACTLVVRCGCAGGGKGALVSEGVSLTLDTRNMQTLFDEKGDGVIVRRLTPLECERLQGFPDGFTQIPYRGRPAEECPDGPRYKAVGNSMAVPVMRWIGERIALADAEEEEIGTEGMSYDIRLLDPVSHEQLHAEAAHDMRGGSYAIGGTTELRLSVTYNYARHYGRVMEGGTIRSIYGKTGAESIPMLEAAAAKLSDEGSADYWEPTEGNAKRALLQLAAMARMRPDGVWDGD